jgi:hypothetical protein
MGGEVQNTNPRLNATTPTSEKHTSYRLKQKNHELQNLS